MLRTEATIHNGDDFRVYRPKEGEPQREFAWRRMRRGIADLHRWAGPRVARLSPQSSRRSDLRFAN